MPTVEEIQNQIEKIKKQIASEEAKVKAVTDEDDLEKKKKIKKLEDEIKQLKEEIEQLETEIKDLG